jgi:ParB family chromosome partitioning protein
MLQPVVVRATREGSFELVAGERRWRAAQLAGLLKIPAIVKDVEDSRLLELALIENLQREDLNPIDSARAFRSLVDDLGMTQEEVADRVGKKRSTVTNSIRLLALPARVQDLLREGQVSLGHAKALAGLSSARQQVELAERIAAEALSVREVERLIQRASKPLGGSPKAKPRPDVNVVDAEQRLQKALGTRVRIVTVGQGGRIELHFFSEEEMRRVYDLVLAAAQTKSHRPLDDTADIGH